MRSIHLTVEPKTPTEASGSDAPYAIQVSSPGPYADREENGIRVAAWGTGLCNCFTHLVPNCFMATLCPCVSLAQIASRLSLHRFKTVLYGLLSVAIVQLLIAVVAFAQVHDSGRSSLHEDHLSRQPSWWPKSVSNLYSQSVAARYDDSDDDDAEYRGGSSFDDDLSAMATSPWGVLCVLLSLVYVVFAWRLRMKIRERFQIRGSWYQDLVVSVLLPSCNIAQMATHVKSYKPGKCAFGPVDVLPAYSPLY